MSTVSIPAVKSLLLSTTLKDVEQIAATVMKMTNSSGVAAFLANRFNL
jgi:phosphoenolpyruvate-protein kinase (PTS system EI component)